MTQLRQVFIYGRLKSFSRERVRAILVKDGGRIVRSAARADTVVVAHAAVQQCLSSGGLALPFSVPSHSVLLSEEGFCVSLLASPSDTAAGGPYRLEDVAKLSLLPEGTCRALALFDVIGPGPETFAYQDLATAKQAARLLQEGFDLLAIVEASLMLGRRGLRPAQTRLVASSWGEIVQNVGERIVHLSGQFSLVLEDQAASADRLFDEAIEVEAQGDLASAVRLYEQAERLDRRDPVIPFNRGNALVAASRRAEAMIAFRQALRCDPTFAEAAFNLAHLLEEDRRTVEAEALYRQALTIHPRYAAAAYNLARILTDRGEFAEAIPLWERFVAAAPADPDAARARQMMQLCRFEAAKRTN